MFATAIFTFVFAWNEFLFALVLTRTEVTTYTVQVTHYFLGGQSNFWAKISAMSVLGTLPIFVVVAFVQRHSRPRNLAGGSEGVSPRNPEERSMKGTDAARAVRLCGTTQPDVLGRVLTAGPLSVELDGGQLRYLTVTESRSFARSHSWCATRTGAPTFPSSAASALTSAPMASP